MVWRIDLNQERTPRKRKKRLEQSKRQRVVDGVPVPSSHTMKLRSDTIISTSLLFYLIISQRSELMELDKFKTMMNVRERMAYFLRFQRMAGSENQVTIDEEAWKLVLPDQCNLSGEHEKAIREGLEIFANDINSIENDRARKYFIIHYCYMRKKTISECVEMVGTSVTSYHRHKQIAVLNFARIHQNGELEVYKQAFVVFC